MREKIEETLKIAREELEKAQRKYKVYYDRSTKRRTFSAGDKVLILLPTESNKLLMRWREPYSIVSPVGECDYRINVGSKVNHVNLLKGFVQRPNQTGGILADEIEGLLEKVTAVVLETDDCDQSNKEEEQLPWLGICTAEETYRDVSVGKFLSPTQKSEAKAIIQEFRDIFTDLPGTTRLGSHSIKLTTLEPISCRPYCLPFALRDTLRRDIEQMKKMGVIRKSTSPYASPVVLVKKKYGSN